MKKNQLTKEALEWRIKSCEKELEKWQVQENPLARGRMEGTKMMLEVLLEMYDIPSAKEIKRA